MAYWFGFSGEPWLIQYVLLSLDHLCKLTAIQVRGPATVFFKTARPGFPGGLVVKNSSASAGDMGLIPRLERSHVGQDS